MARRTMLELLSVTNASQASRLNPLKGVIINAKRFLQVTGRADASQAIFGAPHDCSKESVMYKSRLPGCFQIVAKPQDL